MVWGGTWEALRPTHLLPETPAATGDGTGSWSVGASLNRFWTTIPVLLLLAAFLSCAMSVATAIYMAMRRVCDGQDWSELWMPGMIAGTMAQSLAGRAKVAQEIGAVPPAGVVIESEDE
jgi:hypothetical protein